MCEKIESILTLAKLLWTIHLAVEPEKYIYLSINHLSIYKNYIYIKENDFIPDKV